MITLIALAWPIVALVGIGVATWAWRVRYRSNDINELLATSMNLTAKVRALQDLADLREKMERVQTGAVTDVQSRLEKLERLNQGVPPKGERHTPEHLARFR